MSALAPRMSTQHVLALPSPAPSNTVAIAQGDRAAMMTQRDGQSSHVHDESCDDTLPERSVWSEERWRTDWRHPLLEGHTHTAPPSTMESRRRSPVAWCC